MAYGNATENGSAGSADLQSFLADVPFIAIGILGFAAAKLLFAFNGMTRGSLLILLSVFTAFLAVIFEAFRIFRPSGCPDAVMGALACLREVFLSVSIFIRYLFFLDYSARWPRTIYAKRVGWWERPAFRAICDGAFLFLAVAILVLQLVWRLAHLPTVPIVRTVDAALEISWTTLLALRLCGSFSTSSIVGETPACAKLLPPVGAALLIEWGISVGNAVAFDFADSVAGRFLQAAEAYMILLALMTATFSNLISPASMSRAASLAGSRKKPWTWRILGRGNDTRQDDVEKQQQSPRVSVELDLASVQSSEIVQWRKREALGRDSAFISDTGTSSLRDLSLLHYPAGGSETGLKAPRPMLLLHGVLSSLTLPSRVGGLRHNRTVGSTRATRRSSAPTIMVTSGSDSQDTCARRAGRSAIGSSVPQYMGTLDTSEVASRNRRSQQSVSNASCVTALGAPKGGVVGTTGLLDQAPRVGMGQNASNFIYHARKSIHGEISHSSLPSSPVPALDACPPATLSVPATSPFARAPEGLRIVTADLASNPRYTSSATQWDVTAFISEMSDPPKATAPPASALSSSDIDLDRRGPISTVSLAPSPVLPRPPPRMQLRRNADVFTTLVSAMGYSKDTTEPEPQERSGHLPFDSEPVRPADHDPPEPRVA